MKLIKSQLYKVFWIDAAGSEEWNDEVDLDKLIEKYEKGVEQVLTFIKESKHFYAFTSGKHIGDNSYCDITLIPKSWAKIKKFK